MNADFIRIAHRKAVWSELQRLLLDKFVAQDGPAKEQIICEEVPFSHKDVTNEALLEVLEMIQQHECDEQLEMRQFEFKRRRPKDDGQQPQPGPQPAAGVAGDDGKQARAEGEVQAQGNGPSPPQREPPPAPADISAGSKPAKAGRGG